MKTHDFWYEHSEQPLKTSDFWYESNLTWFLVIDFFSSSSYFLLEKVSNSSYLQK